MTQHGPFEGPLPDGWEGGTPVTKYWNGDYIHLYHVMRPCVSCGAVIGLDVSKKALQGVSKNSGLLLRNCPKCREERKNGGPGSRGGTSRPQIVIPAPDASTTQDTETLQMANNVMREELAGLYARNAALLTELEVTKAENEVLRNRFAPYELQPAMERAAKMPADVVGQQLMREFAAKNKMPWEQNSS